MPNPSQVTKDFLRKVFADEKKLFKKNQVSYITIPYWDELSVIRLWPDLKKDVLFNVYFQDEYVGGKAPSREYFFNILNTIYPEYTQQILANASA